MGLVDRIKDKTPNQLLIMDLKDVSHTMKKYADRDNNTQFNYALEVLDARIKDLEVLLP